MRKTGGEKHTQLTTTTRKAKLEWEVDGEWGWSLFWSLRYSALLSPSLPASTFGVSRFSLVVSFLHFAKLLQR